ncbi:hypothetical protein SAMN05421841_0623 [Chryseobacterium wanjuense]|jgi:hypothetical protein|uniref:Lipoprotein n=1 Tax=Chryseobacterium wanjuense TaxID=356305 RepID=A0A1I0NIT3_9FLAO|nr:hypothetical protein [Chryseobacterium wanjuense]SEW01411.1 hypothetical protein SAMN05421841_0623 [Chryseobacterium wanjuense]
MKKLLLGAVVGSLFLASCAQNKEKREEFKDDHDKSAMRNSMGDSAVANSEIGPEIDSTKVNDTVKTK